MINYKEKPLEQLTLEEVIEFEKEMRKKVLTAAKANMSQSVIDQFNVYIEMITLHKQECMQIRNLDNEKDDGLVLTLGLWDETQDEDEQELSDDSE